MISKNPASHPTSGQVLEPDPVDLASVGLGGSEAGRGKELVFFYILQIFDSRPGKNLELNSITNFLGKGKGANNGNPDDQRWSGEARYCFEANFLRLSFNAGGVMPPFGHIYLSLVFDTSMIMIKFLSSRAGGLGEINQGINIDFGAAKDKVS